MADFRSDTLTQPTERMREAMARAEVGDDVFGEDPTIRRLEAAGAELTGMAAALFVPSGTMGNQISVHVHCQPGDELICEERSHVFQFEGASVARLSGTQVRTVAASRGFPEPDQVRSAVRPRADAHFPSSRVLVIENTHNMAGGTVLGVAGMQALIACARELELAVHVDGARVVNAAVACGVSPAELLRGVDSVSMCLSKGLGAPVGSLLAGSEDFIARAHRVRKAFGGGMRQAGVIAAAGLIALEEGTSIVAEDHRRARAIADGLASIEGVTVVPPDTNIVMVDLVDGADSLRGHWEERGVRALLIGPQRLRLVTHRDVDDECVARCVESAIEWGRQR